MIRVVDRRGNLHQIDAVAVLIQPNGNVVMFKDKEKTELVAYFIDPTSVTTKEGSVESI